MMSKLQEAIRQANPAFVAAVVCIPVGGLVYAVQFGSLSTLNYVHIMTGGVWTGIDLFMGFVLGPVLGSMDPPERAGVFRRLIPKMTFLMPVLAAVAITSGIQLSQRLDIFSYANPWILAALILVALLTVQGFGVILPNEIRIYRELLSDSPDTGKISRLGMRNAKLGGVQGVLQLAIIYVMANIRF
jgi:hypothetical protein